MLSVPLITIVECHCTSSSPVSYIFQEVTATLCKGQITELTVLNSLSYMLPISKLKVKIRVKLSEKKAENIIFSVTL